MGYFSYLASQAFATAPTGQRVFYRGTPASRPYVIPDAETEQRLFEKQRWIFRIFVGGMIALQPFVFLYFPQLVQNPLWFVGYIAAMIVAERIIGRLVFGSELKKLERLPQPLPQRDYYSAFAERHSVGMLRLGVAVCVLFVLAGLATIFVDPSRAVVATLSAGFFGVCGVMWAQALRSKLERPLAHDGGRV